MCVYIYIYTHLFFWTGGTAARPTDSRTTWNSTWRLATSGLPSFNRRPREEKRLGERLGSTLRPGLAALKAHRFRPRCGGLGAEGHKNDRAPSFRRDKDLQWRQSAETSPLLEIALFLRHKTQKERKMTLAKRLLALKQKVRSIKLGRMINSWKHFVDSGLF